MTRATELLTASRFHWRRTTFVFCLAAASLAATRAFATVGESTPFTVDTRIFGESGTFAVGTGAVGVPGDGGTGSLRDSILGAPVGGTLTFSPLLDGATITLSGTPLTIDKHLTITAAGLPNGVTISGGNASRVMEVLPGVTAVLDNLGIVDGDAGAGSGGGILNGTGHLTVRHGLLSGNTAATGGAIDNDGTLVLSDAVLSGNTATSTGGAIHNDGALTVSRSTFAGNTAGGAGGAVYNTGGSATFTNVLVSGNGAGTDGGGLYSGPGGNASFKNATLTGNSAAVGGAVRNDAGTLTLVHATVVANNASAFGGGLDISAAQMNIENTIVAANTGPSPGNGRDIARRGGSSFFVSGGNLIGNNETAEFFFPPGPRTGTPGSPLASRVAPLDNYGGLIPTMALEAESPAIDAAVDTFNTPATDQRGPGFARMRGTAPDIGAYETGTEAGYAVWSLEQIESAADRSFAGDAESDGVTNGFEYAFRFNPEAIDAALLPRPVFVDNGGSPEVRFTMPFRTDAEDLLYILERGTDLVGFSEIYRYDTRTGVETITSPPEVSSAINLGAMEIEVTDTGISGTRTFWRFRLEAFLP